jgi:hypothetical protein
MIRSSRGAVSGVRPSLDIANALGALHGASSKLTVQAVSGSAKPLRLVDVDCRLKVTMPSSRWFGSYHRSPLEHLYPGWDRSHAKIDVPNIGANESRLAPTFDRLTHAGCEDRLSAVRMSQDLSFGTIICSLSTGNISPFDRRLERAIAVKPVAAESADEGFRPPVPMRHRIDQPLATRRSARERVTFVSVSA